jgi:SAM-dependent methyltransferase
LERAAELPSARFLGIDLSRASLAYGTRKARELGITNIRFMQADSLELTDLAPRFDCIESVGVLHHIEDPLRAWQNLIALLNPDGVMKIGLYSQLARTFVTESRQRIAAAGYTASVDDIRRFRWELLHATDQTSKDRFCRVKDFFSLPECRDLYFHAQEHQFTLPQIEEILSVLNLRFLGFEAITPSLFTDYRARFPEDPHATDLRNWHHYEQKHPDLFLNMYQFWVSKK